MRRRLFNLAAVISFALFLATTSMWIYFGRHHPGVALAPTAHIQFAAMAVDGLLVIRLSSVPWPISGRAEIQWGNMGIGRSPLDQSDVSDSASNGRPSYNWVWTLADVAITQRKYPYASRSGRPLYQLIERAVFVPYWLLMILFASLPAWWLLRSRHQRIRDARL